MVAKKNFHLIKLYPQQIYSDHIIYILKKYTSRFAVEQKA
jgi:hypothetical protein